MLRLVSVVASLVVTAPFPNGGTIPKRYTCDGANVAPALTVWPRPNIEAVEVVDLDAPGGIFVHWIRVGSVQGRNTFGKLGYGGPCPPQGNPPHRYVFRVYALRRQPKLRAGFTDAQFHRAIRGLVVAQGSLLGHYGR